MSAATVARLKDKWNVELSEWRDRRLDDRWCTYGLTVCTSQRGTKTSVLFLQKWNDDESAGPLCPRVDDYPIFFAASDRAGKNNSGDYVYTKDEGGLDKLDGNGHLVVDHDLHGHNGELPEGIAESFITWAKCQGLSFWKDEV